MGNLIMYYEGRKRLYSGAGIGDWLEIGVQVERRFYSIRV